MKAAHCLLLLRLPLHKIAGSELRCVGLWRASKDLLVAFAMLAFVHPKWLFGQTNCKGAVDSQVPVGLRHTFFFWKCWPSINFDDHQSSSTSADGGREGAGGGWEGADVGKKGGGSLWAGKGVGPCNQVEAFKWPKCVPPLFSCWEPGRRSEAWLVRCPLAPNLHALRCAALIARWISIWQSLAILQMLRWDRQIDLAPDAALDAEDDEGNVVRSSPIVVEWHPVPTGDDPHPPSITKQPPGSEHEALELWKELSRFAIETKHNLPYYMVGCAHKLEQVLRDG